MMIIDKLIRSKRQSIAIQISQNGELIVRAPMRCSYEKIEKVLIEKKDWIEIHREKIIQNRVVNSDIISYKQVLFLGYTRPIIFDRKVRKIFFDNGCFYISEKYSENLQKTKRLIAKFLIEQAKEILIKRVYYFANIMQLKPNSVCLCNSRRIWGSCSKTSDIKLNWRLVMISPDLIDYVVVHELSHILEFNHSKSFWKLVSSVLPNYKELRGLLKKGDFLLALYR